MQYNSMEWSDMESYQINTKKDNYNNYTDRII